MNTDELKELARKDDEYHRWSNAMNLLSLDAVEYFKQELGLESFNLVCVRQIARDLLTETGAGFDYDINPPELPDTFKERIGERIGQEQLTAVELWFKDTFPYEPGEWKCLTVWQRALWELVKKWDSREMPAGTPLSGTKHSHYRLQIREFVYKLQAERTEVGLLSELSEWDRLFETHLMEDYVESSLTAILQDRETNLWLPKFFLDFPKEEILVFAQWWKDHHFPEECLQYAVVFR